MAFTPKFQEIYDKVQALIENKAPKKEVQEFFKESVKNLDPLERINNLYRIRPKRPIPGQPSRMQFFTANKMQTEFWKNHTNRDLVLKMRQGGVTTFSCLIALDKALWEDGVHTAIMAHVQPNVRKFFKIIKSAFKWFQKDWGGLYPVTEKVDNVNELVINETGSELIVCTESKGLTLDFLHISEACFVDDSRISESLESVPISGWVILESTPDTAAGMFYEMWDLCLRNEPCSFKSHFFEWWYQYPEEEDLPILKKTKDFHYTDKEEVLVKANDLTPEHIMWRRMKISECGGDEGEFQRKYPEEAMTCFLSGSRSVFPESVLSALWRNEKPPAYYGDLVKD